MIPVLYAYHMLEYSVISITSDKWWQFERLFPCDLDAE